MGTSSSFWVVNAVAYCALFIKLKQCFVFLVTMTLIKCCPKWEGPFVPHENLLAFPKKHWQMPLRLIVRI